MLNGPEEIDLGYQGNEYLAKIQIEGSYLTL